MGAACCTNEGGTTVETISEQESFGAKVNALAGALTGSDHAVRVTIVGVTNLSHPDWRASQGPKGPYVVCEVPGKSGAKVRTPPAKDTSRDPTWNHEEVMANWKSPDTLLFIVFDSDFDKYERHLGKARLSAAKIEASKGKYEGDLILAGVDGATPSLKIKVEYCPRPREDPGTKPKARPQSMVVPGRRTRLCIQKDQGQPLGVLLYKTTEGEVLIAEMETTGAVAQYNAGVKLTEQVQVGDRILEANGVNAHEGIISELCYPEDVELVVEARTEIFKVNIEKKPGQKLGLELKYREEQDALVVRGVGAGAVQEHNEQAENDNEKVMAGDHIMSVNGITLGEPRMQELQNAADTVALLVRRVFGLPKDLGDGTESMEAAKEEEKKPDNLNKNNVP
mmetsp:Transcript_22115/g.66466  ORF Transcript_22115/g.66466 Transcript_22115/m.66466 type:complete len:395 (-) Transcript_22115:139-1323(-)